MSSVSLTKVILPIAIIISGMAVAIGLTRSLEASRPALPPDYEDSDLNMDGSSLKGFAFGMEGLMADWYFIRSLQYVGDKMIAHQDEVIDLDNLRPLNPRLLYPLLDNATDLDPHFIAAYSYGAVVMPAIDPAEAIELAKKGIENNPDKWRLYQHLAYIYWKLGRYDEAAEMYQKGSEIEGASPFMRLMAASMKTHGGSRETARAIFAEMLQTTDDEQVRITADRRLKELAWLDQRDVIDAALADFSKRNGHCAFTFEEVFPALLGVKLPADGEFVIDRSKQLIDPSGAPYVLDRDECKVKLDVMKTGLPLK
ncbi:MAG: tetratricopeptide repeat protein [Acidobacteria bacterium]|nr:tetratricopeptide repeat protein [Acidobacteriota bacterium]